MTASHTDERLAAFLSENGLEGYGFWWLLMEVVAAQCVDEKCSVTYTLPHWSRMLYCHHHKASKYLDKLSANGLIIVDYLTVTPTVTQTLPPPLPPRYPDVTPLSKHGVTVKSTGSNIMVTIPNLLKYRDEYTRKSGQNPDSVRRKKEKENIEQIQSIEEEKTLEAGVSPVKKPSKPRTQKLSDDEWMTQIKANPAYVGIDIDRLIGKCQAWCLTKGKQITRARIVNWLNREETPLVGMEADRPRSFREQVNRAAGDAFERGEY